MLSHAGPGPALSIKYRLRNYGGRVRLSSDRHLYRHHAPAHRCCLSWPGVQGKIEVQRKGSGHQGSATRSGRQKFLKSRRLVSSLRKTHCILTCGNFSGAGRTNQARHLPNAPHRQGLKRRGWFAFSKVLSLVPLGVTTTHNCRGLFRICSEADRRRCCNAPRFFNFFICSEADRRRCRNAPRFFLFF